MRVLSLNYFRSRSLDFVLVLVFRLGLLELKEKVKSFILDVSVFVLVGFGGIPELDPLANHRKDDHANVYQEAGVNLLNIGERVDVSVANSGHSIRGEDERR